MSTIPESEHQPLLQSSPIQNHKNYICSMDINNNNDTNLLNSLESKGKDSKISTHEIFRLANQSVDDFLNEMNNTGNDIDASLPELPNSPVTEPLHVEKNILDDFDDYTPDADISLANSIILTKPYNLKVNGPKELVSNSPVKSPKKVSIESSVPEVLVYNNEKCYTNDKLEQTSQQSRNVSNSSTDSAPWETIHQSKPLPKIRPSDSNYSVKSMPNISAEYSDNDSDYTVAPSPATQLRSFSKEGLSKLTNRFSYDHANYMVSLERGELDDSADIKDKKNKFEKLKAEISYLPIESKTLSKSIVLDAEDNLRRANSVKSILSIPSSSCKLETKNIGKAIVGLSFDKGINGLEDVDIDNAIKNHDQSYFASENENEENENSLNNDAVSSAIIKLVNKENTHEKQLDHIIELINKEDTIVANIQQVGEIEDNNKNDIDVSTVDDNVSNSIIEAKNGKANQHKRSTSLSEIVGRFLKSMSSKSIAQDAKQSDDEFVNENNENQIEICVKDDNVNSEKFRQRSSRNVSGVSVATTATEGFVSALEDFESDILAPSSEGDESTVLLNDSSVDAHESTPNTSETQDTATVSSIPSVHANENDSPNNSFSSDKFILHVPFDDNIYAEEYDKYNISDAIPISTLKQSSRVPSLESSNKNDILGIWNQQKSFRQTARKLSDFDSVKTPIKSYVIAENRPKAIRILNSQNKAKRIDSDELVPSHWILKKLEVLPSGVNKHSTKKSIGSISTLDAPVINPFYENATHSIVMDSTIESDISMGTTIVKNKPRLAFDDENISTHNTDEETDISSTRISKGKYHLDVDLDQTMHFSQIDQLDVENNLSTQGPLNDAELTSGLTDLLDDSFVKVINHWDPEISNHEDVQLLNTFVSPSNDILKKVWNDSRNDSTHLDGYNHSDQQNMKHLEHGQFEDYLNQKRIVSDEFKVKTASHAKGFMQEADIPVEQRASYYNFDNSSYSKIVPELDISMGIPAHKANPSIDSFKTANSAVISKRFVTPTTPPRITMADAYKNSLVPSLSDTINMSPERSITEPEIQLSPAHKKMQEKMAEQAEMKRSQIQHQIMQRQLRMQMREEAKIIERKTRNPSISLNKSIELKSSKKDIPDAESINDIYEEFEKVPMLIQPADFGALVSNTSIPNSPANPFETPKRNTHLESPSSTPLKNKSTNEFSSLLPMVELKNDDENKNLLVNGERGRLFIRMNNVGDFKLPNISGRNAKIQMTLDNGIHCLKTGFLDINSESLCVINKEFELIVADNLDIIMTFKIKYDKPKAQKVIVAEKKKFKVNSKLGRLFGKTKIEIVKKEIEQKLEYDAMSNHVAVDGSFAKIKLAFRNYEKDISGKITSYKLTCYNEWNKASKQPVPVCTINLDMLFIPRTLENETLPISISNALNQADQAKKVVNVKHEGFMFQDGGDLKLWTRRFYKLEGYDLMAFSDENKMKAKINLRKITDISSANMPNIVTTNSKNKTKPSKRVFSESLMLSNGFRLHFANGETIEFGCDSPHEMDVWLGLLEQLISMNNFNKQPWIKLMLHREINTM